MSQLVVTAHTSADSIPLGRRIAEIMHEKGQAYSITTMAKRLGFNRETFRLMLKGDREIYSYELDRIAQDLKVPVERILQHDVLKESRELKELLANSADKRRALEISIYLSQLAIGMSEGCITSNYVGSSYYLLREYDAAHRAWIQALPQAKLMQERYNDSGLLLKITANLMLSYTIRKEYSNLFEVVSNAEPFFSDEPFLSGIICYSIAKIKEQQGEFDEARAKHYQSLSFYQMTHNPVFIAKSKHNLAAFEYRRKDYHSSKEYFELAVQEFENTEDLFGKILCYKEFAKVFVKLDEIDRAHNMIRVAIEQIHRANNHEDFCEINAQLHILLSVTNNEPIYADQVLFNQLVSTNIRKIAGKFLVDYYNRIGDFVSMAKYHKVVNGLEETKIDILHEEDL